MSHDIFLSLRFGEAMAEATLLKKALEDRGFSVFLCDVPAGKDIASTVARALDGAKLVVIMGTRTYGVNTGAGFSTFEELRFVIEEKKHFVLVKMCDNFEVSETKLRLSLKSVSYIPWTPGAPMPPDIFDKIAQRFQGLSHAQPTLPQAQVNQGIRLNLAESLRQHHGKIVRVAMEQNICNLDVYVPLQYGLRKPPLSPSEVAYPLNDLMHALMFGTPQDIGSLVPSGKGALRTLLLQGYAGTGKSLFGWHMMQHWDQLPLAEQQTARIPIVINLAANAELVRQAVANPNNKDADDFLLSQLVATYDNTTITKLVPTTADELHALYEEGFVFILDGVDELVDKLHINRLYNIAKWTNSVFVVASRTAFFDDDGEGLDYCAPLDAARRRLLTQDMGCIHLLPFNESQVSAYVQAFAQKYNDVYGWSEQEYLAALARFAQLKEFLVEPLVLYLVLNVLPSLGLDRGAPRLHRIYLQVTETPTDDDVFPRLTRAELYSLFAYNWAKREAQRLSKLDEHGKEDFKFVEQVTLFCEKLAFEMFLHDTVQVSIACDGPERQRVLEQSDPRLQFSIHSQGASSVSTDAFLLDLLKMKGAYEHLQCSPLKRNGPMNSFLHKTVQEYFVAMHIMRDLGANRFSSKSGFEVALLCGNVSGLQISKQLVTTGNMTNILRFCADLVDGRAQEYISFGPVIDRSTCSFVSQCAGELPGKWKNIQPSARAMWDVVQASRLPCCRKSAAVAIAAANAMMVLNASGMIFSGCDLSHATLGLALSLQHSISSERSIGAASSPVTKATATANSFLDVSGGVFSGAKLDDSMLRRSRLDGCNFTGASLAGADLTEAKLGLLPILLGHTFLVSSVCMSSDGKHIVSGSFDRTVRVWDMANGSLLRTLEGHTCDVTSVCMSRDGKHIVSGSTDGKVRVWDMASGSLLRTLQGQFPTETVTSVCMNSDGKHLVFGSYDNTVRVWDLASKSLLRSLKGHTDWVTSVCISSDGKHIVSGSKDCTVRVWDTASGCRLRTLESNTSGVTSVCMSSDSKHIVSGAYDNSVRVWDMESGSLLRTLQGHNRPVMSVCMSSDGRHIVSGSWDKTVRVWDMASGSLLRTLEGHNWQVTTVCVSNDGKLIVSGSDDKTVRVWDTASESLLRTLEGHTSNVWSVCTSSDGKHIVSGSSDKKVRVWDMASGSLLRTLQGHTRPVMSVCMSSDGKHIVSGSQDDTVRVWDMASGSSLHFFEGHTCEVTSVCMSSDGKHIVSGSYDDTVRVWDMASGSLLRTLKGHTREVMSVCMSNDGKHVISVARDNTVRVWDMASGSLLRTLKGHTCEVTGVCMSSDDRHIVSGSYDKTVRVWDMASGSLLCTIEGHTDPVMSVCISSDGKHIVSGSSDKTVRVWDMASGSLLCTLEGHTETVTSVCMSSDGKHIISGSVDKTVRVWDYAARSDGAAISVFRNSECLFRFLGNQASLTFKDCCCTGMKVDAKNALLIGQLGGWALNMFGRKTGRKTEGGEQLQQALTDTCVIC